MHLGNAEQLLARLQQGRAALCLCSVSAGAVDAAIALAAELNCAPIINEEVAAAGGQGRRRDGLSVGESLLAKVLATEPIRLGAIAYDTTNFLPTWTAATRAANWHSEGTASSGGMICANWGWLT